LILDNELHGETIAHRLPKVAEARCLPVEEWTEHLCVESLRGRLADIFNMRRYFESLEPGRFKVIVLDAFYRFLPKDTDENDNATIAGIYNVLDQYAGRLGCVFVLIHHSSKGLQSEKAVTDVGAGAGAQSRAADTHLILRQHQEDDAVVLDAAVRSWPPVEPFCLRWHFPVWEPAPDLGPADLRKGQSKKSRDRANEAQTPAASKPEPWTPERFAAKFVSAEPVEQLTVLAKARAAKLTGRQADDLLRLALAGGRIFRWSFPKTSKVYLANQTQPVTATLARADTPPTHAHPPTPPRRRESGSGVGGRTGGGEGVQAPRPQRR
jgi:hypothetical protein